MRVAWNHSRSVLFRQVNERALRVAELLLNVINFGPQPEPQVRRHLIISTATRVKLPACVANELNQTRFNKRVDIFRRQFIKISRIRLCTFDDSPKPVLNLRAFCVRQNTRRAQAFAMREARLNIHSKQPAIKAERAVESCEPLISLAHKPPTPQIFRLLHSSLRLTFRAAILNCRRLLYAKLLTNLHLKCYFMHLCRDRKSVV